MENFLANNEAALMKLLITFEARAANQNIKKHNKDGSLSKAYLKAEMEFFVGAFALNDIVSGATKDGNSRVLPSVFISILGNESIVDNIRDHHFNGKKILTSWEAMNFHRKALREYTQRLEPGEQYDCLKQKIGGYYESEGKGDKQSFTAFDNYDNHINSRGFEDELDAIRYAMGI